MRSWPLVLAIMACGGPTRPRPPSTPDLPARVVSDFEAATLAGPSAWAELFDFAAVGAFEILLHRYDLGGRLELSEELRARYAAEDGTPYPAERERRNVGTFFRTLAQRTVARGGCRPAPLATAYSRALGSPFEALPPATPAGYVPLREQVNAWLARGGVVGIACPGGRGRLALVYTARPETPRGYALISIYDDEPPARR